MSTSISTTTVSHKDGTKAIAEGGNGTGIAEGGNGNGAAEGGNEKGTAEGGNGKTKSQQQRSNGSGAIPKFRTFSGSISRPFSGRKVCLLFKNFTLKFLLLDASTVICTHKSFFRDA